MLTPQVTKLYKYRAFDENSIRMVLKNEIWFSKPSYFNDPFDCELIPSTPKTNKDKLHQIFVIIDRLYSPKKAEMEKAKILLENKDKETVEIKDETISQYFEEVKNIGVFSLSEKNDNILMWSHYADNHQGICIEFSREKNSKNFLSHHMCRPVNYVSKYPNLNKVTHLEEVNVYTKAEEWKYEAEWRLVSKEGNIVLPLPAPITAIIFGLKASDKCIETFKNLIIGKNIKLYKAQKKLGEFALDIIEFNELD